MGAGFGVQGLSLVFRSIRFRVLGLGDRGVAGGSGFRVIWFLFVVAATVPVAIALVIIAAFAYSVSCR